MIEPEVFNRIQECCFFSYFLLEVLGTSETSTVRIPFVAAVSQVGALGEAADPADRAASVMRTGPILLVHEYPVNDYKEV